MSQHPYPASFILRPDNRDGAAAVALEKLLVPGSIMDSSLASCCRRLRERFSRFRATCPAPEWAEGLVITPEIRRQYEIYLPIAEIRAGFRALIRLSCRYSPFLKSAALFSARSWPDALNLIGPPLRSANPARIIADAARDEAFRVRLLAALFVPRRYGGSFDRYPYQQEFLHGWLAGRSGQGLSALDAACGSGEGVYGLARMFCTAGIDPASSMVHGCTVEPLELVAAAHGWFPNDPRREADHRRVIGSLSGTAHAPDILFHQADIRVRQPSAAEGYDVVICNGLLGGPLLHEPEHLAAVVRNLAGMVKEKGIILAADRFHDGWRRITPVEFLNGLLEKEGFRVLDLPEGIGGVRI